jgi:Pyruvate/2-oxoacid:ferredoxin oxidoreductase delta subunit
MCEFCTKHGEGEKWFLNVRNYAEELLHDPGRRSMIKNFYREYIDGGNGTISRLERMYRRDPRLLDRIRAPFIREMKSMHFGQVVAIEDVAQILSICNTAVRLPCGCRWVVEKKESRICYGISTGSPGWFGDLDMDYFGAPDVSRLDHLQKEQMLEQIRGLDREGMVHSIWTFGTPFIGAICNCDIKSCLAMRSTVGLQMPIMFRAERLLMIDREDCTGCRECLHACQFGAIAYSETESRAAIDRDRCYGCGVCRNFCPSGAIRFAEPDLPKGSVF